ncbi:MAG: polysaccharide biosynthesis tyrosine autokinase [Bacteroidales bacterium]|nr:polysaccharide biosynthesis tyrosine autokinase [Bacteroidales bacterium]
MAVSKTIAKPKPESLKIQDILSICLTKWRWFAFSLLCTLGFAAYYIVKTPPVYTRYASVLIKEDGNGTSTFSSELGSFADMGMFSGTSNVNNELNAIKSPANIAEVVKNLQLNTSYRKIGMMRTRSLYGKDLPITVKIPSATDMEGVSMTIELNKNGHYTVTDMSKSGPDIKPDQFDKSKEYKGVVGDSLDTQIGKIIVEKTDFFANAPCFRKKDEVTIGVYRSPVYSAVESCQTKLKAEIGDEKTSIIDLTYEDESIQRAEDFLNMLISVYNEKWLRDKNQIAVGTSNFINERLNVIEQELGNVDSDISDYKSEHLIPDLRETSAMYMEKANEANRQLLSLSNELSVAKYIKDFINKEANRFELLPANIGLGNANLEKQITDYNQKILQRNSLVANSGVNNPLVTDLDHSLAAMRASVKTAIDNQIAAINTQMNVFRGSERQSTAQIASTPNQAKYLLSVERQQKVKESLYLFLLQKREENELSQSFTASNTRIITPPTGRMSATAPVKKNVLIVALLLGLFIPLGIIILRENMNTKVRGRKDLENMAVPFAGEIPSKKAKRKGILGRFKKTPSAAETKILVKNKNRNIINEAFRIVRTNVEFMLEQNPSSKVMMLTSINPGSGKSFIAVNLAASYAIKNKRTVLVDLDLRKASLNRYIKTPGIGISDYLSNRVEDWHDLITPVPGYNGFDFIPTGTIPPNPSELIYSNRLEALLKTLREDYDIVILDCPPIDIVADTSIINKWADLTLFVVRAGVLEREMLPVVESIYIEKKYNNMSVILNGTPAYGTEGYRRFGYHVGYGYGHGYGGYTDDDDD